MMNEISRNPSRTVAELCSGYRPGYLRFAYRAPLAPNGRGPVVFLVHLKPLDATRHLVPAVGAREKNMAAFPRFRSRPGLQSEARGARQKKGQPERRAHRAREVAHMKAPT